jgi:hypothetical protein
MQFCYAFDDCKTPQKQQKGKGETKKKKGGREPTIVIVFFHRTTIAGKSSQKLNEIGKTFSSRCGVYLEHSLVIIRRTYRNKL